MRVTDHASVMRDWHGRRVIGVELFGQKFFKMLQFQ